MNGLEWGKELEWGNVGQRVEWSKGKGAGKLVGGGVRKGGEVGRSEVGSWSREKWGRGWS